MFTAVSVVALWELGNVYRHSGLRWVWPWVAALATLIAMTLLIAGMYYRMFNLPWIPFLLGALTASILTMVGRAVWVEWIILGRKTKCLPAAEKFNDVLRPARSGAVENAQSFSEKASAEKGSAEQELFIESFSAQFTGDNNAIVRIKSAIEQNEFCLYCQDISPLSNTGAHTQHHEIFIRLIEEEEGMMPPGAFFPLVEKYGLMPHLDRWVVRHVVQWAASRAALQEQSGDFTFFINLALPTLSDSAFPKYVQTQLAGHGMPAGLLCFEVSNAELMRRHEDVVAFVTKIRALGCGVAISGFGRDRVSFESLRGLKVDYLKIDGGVILNVPHGPTELAKVTAIARVAKTIGVKTIAELVESEACITKLHALGIDFVQGFGVSIPRPLSDLAAR